MVTTFSGNIGFRRIVLGLDGNAVVVVMEEADVDKTSRFVGQALIKIGAALHSGEINTRF